MKRTKTLTFCAILFFWIAFASLIFNPVDKPRTLPTIISSVFYSIASFIAALSLWKVKPWAPLALYLLMGVSFVNLIVFHVTYKQSLMFLIAQFIIGLLLLKPMVNSIKAEVQKTSLVKK